MKKALRTLGVVLALSVPIIAPAADHLDSPTAATNREPTADITDLYAWTTADATKLNLVMAVGADAQEGDVFSDAVIYEFAVSSAATYGAPQESTLITCKFIDGVNIECWAGNDYVVGDASDPEGIVSDNEGMRVFAGLRDDPFFLEYTGFNNAVTAAVAAVTANEVEFDPAKDGCPSLTEAQQTALLGLLTHGADGVKPSNTFAGQNVLALVIQIDLSIVNGNGPVLGVSAATYSSN
jgi:uncharacterized protein DUF4331